MPPLFKFVTLVRRELWEHGNLWRLPLLLLLLGLLANIAFTGTLNWLDVVPEALLPEQLTGQLAGHVASGTLRSLGALLYLLFALLAAFYLSDSLHAERQDRSILFWRSLPASDLLTVLSKLFVGVVIVPLLLWLTVIAIQTLSLGWQTLAGGFDRVLRDIAPTQLLTGWFDLLRRLAIVTLWTLPAYAWVLFCSSWSRRTPLLTALAIPTLLVLLEKSLGQQWGLYRLFREHLPPGGGLARLSGLQPLSGLPADAGSAHGSGAAPPALWLGLAAAALLAAATVWVRRWRDDG